MALADDVFRLAHHHVTGRPRLNPHVLALALAAGLLGELVDAHVIEVGDYIQLIAGQPPADTTAREMLAVLLGQREQWSTRDWLAYFSDRATAKMVDRMTAGNHLEKTSTLFGRRTRYRPTDMNVASGPEALLAYSLRGTAPFDYPAQRLAGFVVATGLDVSLGFSGQQRARLRAAADSIDRPAMIRLIAHLEAAVGAAVMGHRT